MHFYTYIEIGKVQNEQGGGWKLHALDALMHVSALPVNVPLIDHDVREHSKVAT